MWHFRLCGLVPAVRTQLRIPRSFFNYSSRCNYIHTHTHHKNVVETSKISTQTIRIPYHPTPIPATQNQNQNQNVRIITRKENAFPQPTNKNSQLKSPKTSKFIKSTSSSSTA